MAQENFVAAFSAAILFFLLLCGTIHTLIPVAFKVAKGQHVKKKR